jgi:hypothetical protein
MGSERSLKKTKFFFLWALLSKRRSFYYNKNLLEELQAPYSTQLFCLNKSQLFEPLLLLLFFF